MESYIVSEVPTIVGNDASLQSKATALAGYYFNDQGGPVSAIVQTVAGVNLTAVFAQVNTTRDQAIAVSTPGTDQLLAYHQLHTACHMHGSHLPSMQLHTMSSKCW